MGRVKSQANLSVSKPQLRQGRNSGRQHSYQDGGETKRTVRKTHLQPDEVDTTTITLEFIENRVTYPTKTLSSLASNVREIGSW